MMDVKESVEYILNAAYGPVRSFFIDTIIGKLAIEFVNESNMDNANMIVRRWVNAPDTKWCRENSSEKADVYISIPLMRKDADILIKMKAVEAFHRALFLKKFGIHVGMGSAFAATMSYLLYIDKSTISINYLVDKYMDSYYSVFAKNNSAMRSVVRSMIESKLELAEHIIRGGRKIIRMSKQNFKSSNDYDTDIFEIACYLIQNEEEKESAVPSNVATRICDNVMKKLTR